MYAVFETGGKQYRVSEGDVLRVEKLPAEEGSEVQFETVLLVGDGEGTRVGRPYVEGGSVSALIRSHGRGEKIDVIKFKRRARYRRRQGHRQAYTELEIKGISPGAGKAAGAKKARK